jgi:DNA-directed RNA polymerase subunit beta
MAQTSLTGPGGFAKKSVPTKLKDLDRTMLGKICPVDTPDRENCGVVQNLNPTVMFDEKFQFLEEGFKKSIPSIPIAMVPFLEHTDQTRLQMASSQMKQSILLKNFHVPLICSGAEKQFAKYSSFLYKAEADGEVLYLSRKHLIIGYNYGEVKIIDIGVKPITSENMDVMISDLKLGEKFVKDQTLAYSVFCKNDIITIGQNFKVAFMSYYGYNHEDGIVISDRLVKDGSLTSHHYVDMSFNITPTKVLLDLNEGKTDTYTPLHPIGTFLKKGDTYAMLKEMYLFGSLKNNSYNIFDDCIEKISNHDVMIENITIYANEWYREIKQYDNWMELNIEKQIQKDNEIIQVVANNTDKIAGKRLIAEHNLDSHSYPGKYKNKDELVKGVRIDINGVYERPIQIGDKLANRHGNKGVITLIVEHDKMPKLDDGSHVDICLNPVGVISRMNTGQLFELTLGKTLVDLKKTLTNMLLENTDQHTIKKYLCQYIDLIDKTPDKWIINFVKNNIPEEIDQEYIDQLYIIQPQFDSINSLDLKKITKYTNTKYEERIFDPLTNKYVINDIAVGYMYLMKLVHIAEKKLAYRSIGITSQKTMQPVAGKVNNGGQKCGEMESICLVSNDMPINQHEFYTTKSDCIDGKNNFIKQAIGTDYLDVKDDPDMESETLKLLRAYTAVMGIDMGDNLQ